MLSYIITLPILGICLIADIAPTRESLSIGEINLGPLIFIAIFLAPFLETFIFQTIVFGVLGKISFFSENQIVIIVISAVHFGLGHDYSSLYIVYGMLAGLVFSYGYSIFQSRIEGPYLMTCAVHALRNVVAVLLYALEMN